MSIDRHCRVSSPRFPIKGSAYAFAPISSISGFLETDDMLTTVAVRLTDPKHLDEVTAQIESRLDPKVYETLTWEEFMPEIKQYIVFGNIIGFIASYVNTKIPLNLADQSEWLAYFGIDPHMTPSLPGPTSSSAPV